jgi:hypothetical protein
MGRAYRRFVAKEKKEIGDDLLDFQNTVQIVIPARLNDRLLLDDVVDGQRMLVFASEALLVDCTTKRATTQKRKYVV